MKKLLVAAMSATLLFSACGGSGGPQGEVADLFVEAAEQEDLKIDTSCVSDLTAKISDDDAQAIVDAGMDGDPEVSDETDAIGDQIFDDCVDAASAISGLIDSIVEDGGSDADCLREKFADLSVDEVTEKMFDAMVACSTE